MGKEDLWAKHSQYYEDFGDAIDSNSFFEALDEHAKEQNVLFLVWLVKLYFSEGLILKIKKEEVYFFHIESDKNVTPEELYGIFLKSK